MPSTPPSGEPVPSGGALPAHSRDEVGTRDLGVYVHVPFCTVRCGYCDFNTYTSDELGPGADRASFPAQVEAELRLARRVLGSATPTASTVFVGGGTPTLLGPDGLGEVLDAVRRHVGLTDDAEVTTEANPDSVRPGDLARLRDLGFTRVSFGMQSAVPHVLATLDRTHDPDRVPEVVDEARSAGFEQVSLDLIYGTPGETAADWAATLDAALACGPDHVSAYALVVEPGTALARRVRRGEVSAPEDDDLADKYLQADERLARGGLRWYEVSNWSRDDAGRCRHNLGYWTGADWWGAGPGAHSHARGTRWWNVRHPAAYAQRLAAGESPAQAREVLDGDTRHVERVMLEVRLRDGLDLGVLDDRGRSAVAGLVARGLLHPGAVEDDRAVLTLNGRLLADAVVRDLLP